MKKQVLVWLLFCALAVTWNNAWADFYVIAAGRKAVRTILVSPKATSAESGTALLSALASITDNNWNKQYLIKIEPGIYDLGTSSFDMKPYVDVEGSGEGVTIIQGTVDSYYSAFYEGGVVSGWSDSELRFLTVRNYRTSGKAIALYHKNSTTGFSKILHVTALADGDGTGERYAIFNRNGYAALTHVSAEARATSGKSYGIYNCDHSGVSLLYSDTRCYGPTEAECYAIYNKDSGLSLVDSHAYADPTPATSYGVYHMGSYGDLKAYHSRIIGESNSAYIDSGAKGYFGACELSNFINAGTGGPGTVICAQCYDHGFKELTSTCQLVTP